MAAVDPLVAGGRLGSRTVWWDRIIVARLLARVSGCVRLDVGRTHRMRWSDEQFSIFSQVAIGPTGDIEMTNRTIAMLALRIALLMPYFEYSAAAQSIPKVLGNEKNTPKEVAGSLDHLLSYLPLKTETVIVSNKGFVLEALDPEKMELTTGRLIHHAIVGLPPEFLDTDLGGQFRGRRVTTLVQGSRGFRPPTDLGRVIYAGASFIIFESDVDLARETKMGVDVDKALLGPVRWERVGRHRALRFSVKSEEDVWTYFVAQLAPKIVVCATDRVYLQETLERVASPGNERAFPATLAEWRSLNTKCPFWGMRHYDRSGELHGPPSALSDDKGAVGCSFSFDGAVIGSILRTYHIVIMHQQL